MFGITDIYQYLIGVFIIITLPGPNSLYCLSVATAHGIKSGYQTVWGILLGDTILIILTVIGAGTVLKLYPTVFTILKMIGGAYLAYLGIKMLIGAYQSFINKNNKNTAIDNQPTQSDNQNNIQPNLAQNPPKNKKFPYFYRSLGLSLTNPKAILFFLSFFIAFVNPNYPYPVLSFTILGIVLQVVSFLYLSILVLFGANLVKKLSGKKWVEVGALLVVGCLFIGFAVNLWRASL